MEENVIICNGNFEVRSVGEEEKQTHIQGYALTFDSLSEDLGGFREIIRKNALDQCDMRDVVLNINHSLDMLLARNNVSNGIGSLTLSVDDKGLFFDAVPTNTSYARDLITNIEAGIVSKCSFRFSLDYGDKESQSWDFDSNNRGYDLRTINKIKTIRDVSIVTLPAYESTSCNSYKRAKEDLNNELKNEKRKRRLELELELI